MFFCCIKDNRMFTHTKMSHRTHVIIVSGYIIIVVLSRSITLQLLCWCAYFQQEKNSSTHAWEPTPAPWEEEQYVTTCLLLCLLLFSSTKLPFKSSRLETSWLPSQFKCCSQMLPQEGALDQSIPLLQAGLSPTLDNYFSFKSTLFGPNMF